MSHTVKIQVVMQNPVALTHAVNALEGSVLGEGQHKLYAGQETGFGFTLPQWRFPLVLKADGTLAYDDFNGHWGKVADITHLRERYALEAARLAATDQGWLSEFVDEGLLIHHPDGGTLSVRRDGTLDATDFLGQNCATASEAIEQALGRRQEETLKDEYFAERAKVSVTG